MDHKNGTVHFGGQQLESERVREHIANMAKRLTKVVSWVTAAPDTEKLGRKQKVCSALCIHNGDVCGHVRELCEGLLLYV